MATHGGKRTGSGRKPTGAKPVRAFRLSDSEYLAVKEYIKTLRASK